MALAMAVAMAATSFVINATNFVVTQQTRARALANPCIEYNRKHHKRAEALL